MAALLVLGGCGGAEASGDNAPAASGSTRAIEIRESEFTLEPDTVRLDAAGTYTFRAVNAGSVDHALEIEGNGLEQQTKTIAGGQSAEVTVELAEGTYELSCPVGDHEDRGMAGTVVVGTGGTTTTGGTETEDDVSPSRSDEDYGY